MLFALGQMNAQTAVYSYGFGGVTADLATAGWTRTNQSTSASSTLWTIASYTAGTVTAAAPATPFQNQIYTTGQAYPIPSDQTGAPNSFALVNYTSSPSSAPATATLSNWLISPTVVVQNGDVVSFYTRLGKYAANGQASFADNLQFRMSTNGAASVAPSGGPTGLGDYTNLLVEVNPNLNLTSYPMAWTQYSYTITGMNAPTEVKFAFRYYVTNGGYNGTNSDIIGIDSFLVDRPLKVNDFFASNFTMYPNPASSQLNLSSTAGTTMKNAQITDLNGRVVKSFALSGIEAQLNVSDLNSGVYFVTIENENGKGSAKFVKK